MNRSTIAAATSMLALTLAAPAWADDPVIATPAPERVERWAIDASTGASYITDRSFDLVGGADAMPVGDFRLSYAPGWLRGRLELNLGYAITGEGGTSFQSWQTSFQMQTLQLGALYRWRFGERLSVYGRAAGLLDFDSLSVTTIDDSLPLSQDVVTGGVIGAAGLELMALRDRNFSIGFTLEVGYAQRFESADFDHLTAQVGDPKPAPIAVAAVNAGSIDVSGIQWRLGAAVHF